MTGSSPAPFPCHESLCHERLPRLAEWLEWFFGLRLNERVTQLETFPESGCFVLEDPTRTYSKLIFGYRGDLPPFLEHSDNRHLIPEPRRTRVDGQKAEGAPQRGV